MHHPDHVLGSVYGSYAAIVGFEEDSSEQTPVTEIDSGLASSLDSEIVPVRWQQLHSCSVYDSRSFEHFRR